MHKLVYGLLGAAALAVGSTAANASIFTVTVGDSVTAIPGNNDFQGDLLLAGFTQYATTGTTIVLDETSVVTFELLGTESGFDDTFTANGVTYTETGGLVNLFGSPLLLGSDTFLAGLLSAGFSSDQGGSGGVNSADFGLFLGPNAMAGDVFNASVLYFGFDDQITGDDDNHDDLIIRATISPAVPEPATWAMMLLGFGAAGFMLRRRRAPVLAQAA